jgi:hypothetical protein
VRGLAILGIWDKKNILLKIFGGTFALKIEASYFVE